MRLFIRSLIVLVALWLGATLLAAWILPDHLLKAPLPVRSEAEVALRLDALRGPGDTWTEHRLEGGEGVPLRVRWLHRPRPRGVVLYLHGFGDDAFGTVGYSQSLPDWDAVMFTFRGRDQDPRTPSTLGAWERRDVAAVVAFLEARGAGRRRLLLVGVSQGAGVALLALRDLEASGQPLGGALLESPFRDLGDAARNHLRGVLGRGVVFAVPALEAAIRIAGRRARFDPVLVSPLVAARGLKTPVALLAGDADAITPLEGVRALAVHLTDLTVVSGAGHCEAGARVPGGWGAWAQVRVARWFGDR